MIDSPYSAGHRNFPGKFVERNHVRSCVHRAYLETWNETDVAKRETLLKKYWTDDVTYVDPLMSGEGSEEISGLVGAVHQRLTGFRFKLVGKPNGHGRYVRLSWSLGQDDVEAPIEGSDIVVVEDARIRQVIGFIDRAPTAV